MKKYIIATTTLLCFVFSFSQGELYEKLRFGNHKVGFCDTLIYNELHEVDAYGYQGKIPLFVNIWFPTLENGKQKLTIGQIRDRNTPENLLKYQKALFSKMDSSMIWYNISQDFVKLDSFEYKGADYFQILEEIKLLETKSQKMEFPKDLNFPVIFYHHGAQGLPDENHIMAEFFASHGYIFISANFHQPVENHSYGWPAIWNDKQSDIKKVIEFGKTLSKTDSHFFIGHSWGAQTGFKILWDSSFVDAFISMETTLEFWNEEKVKKTWSSLYEIINKHKDEYSIPILMIANNGPKYDFEFQFFKRIKNAPITKMIPKKEFGHESHTSAYLLRYFLRDKYKQPDEKQMKNQVEIYCRNLQFYLEYLKDYKNSNPDPKFYYFKRYN